MTTRISLLLASTVLLTTGCDVVADDATDITPAPPTAPGTDPGTTPGTDPGTPTPAVADGTYQLTSTFDLTVDAVLPETAYNAVTVLADFRDQPANTLFTLVDDAGVPLVGDVLDALPSQLEDKLYGWIDGYIESALFEGTPVGEVIDEVLAVAETSLTRFDLVSELDLTANPDAEVGGQMTADHRIRGLRFPALGLDSAVDITSLGPVTDTQAIAWIERDGVAADAHLVVDAHAFGLPYGEYAYAAVEMIMVQRYGMSVREILGAALDCPALAAEVADKCVLGVCVGHEQELSAICDQGLDLVVEKLQDKFAEYRFDAIELAAGEAELWDTDTDRRIDRVSDGLWQARIDVGMGLREVPATFDGARP